METLSSAEYYDESNSGSWGNYQYLTLDEIVTDFMASIEPDDYIFNTKRSKVLFHARKAFREMYYDVAKEVRAIELELSPTLKVTLPPDFVNYVRISWVGSDGQLHPMALDKRMSIADVYLQDHEYNLLYDNDGCVLQSSDTENVEDNPELYNRHEICSTGFQPNKSMSKSYPNGRYRVDKNEGYIQFGSSAFSKNIVLEYISDGLYTGCEGKPEENLRVHTFLAYSVTSYFYHRLVSRRRNVPSFEKERARREYVRNKKIARRRMNTIRVDELKQVFKGSSKWIK